MLKVRELTKKFGGFTAVNRVSFDVEQGEILGLIGPNGSGKSTTFNLIAGTLAPTGGSMHFHGEEIGGLPPYRVCHRGIARTFQIPRPFRKLSIRENVELAAFYGHDGRITREEAAHAAAEALDLVGLAPGRPGARRWARRRRPQEARAGARAGDAAEAAARRRILGGLDEHEMDQAADMLSRIRREKNITIIWVEHIMGVLMRVVDRCIVLDHGEVIAAGKPAEVAHDPRVIEVYLGTDAAELQQKIAVGAAARA